MNNEWIPAGDIRLGDTLRRADGAPVVVTSLVASNTDQPVYVPVLAPEHAGYFVEDIFVQNVVGSNVYDEFRRVEANPVAILDAMDHLVAYKMTQSKTSRSTSLPSLRERLADQ